MNILQFGTNTFSSLEKYILKFGEIHFAIWRNTLCNFNKYITATEALRRSGRLGGLYAYCASARVAAPG